MKKFGVNTSCLFGRVFEMFFDDFWSYRNDVLTFPIFDQSESLQGADNVFCLDCSHGTDVFDG